ncbi:HAD family hydrolase [Microbacterium halotolerans]|uniref:HAD family hydrolase n=1 Tax=Microbacterium halotolerans TaxID=246613 RepID=UPI0013C2BB27|nr:HAD family phosphatase [Microbacterium halotolerans]
MRSESEPRLDPSSPTSTTPRGWEHLLAEASAGDFAAVLFDCDGTLVDSEPLCERAWEDVTHDYDLPSSAAAPGASFPQRIAALRESHPGIPASTTLYRAYWSRLRALYRAKLRPIPRVYDLAVALHASELPIAVVSNSDQARLEFTIDCAAPLLHDVPLIGLRTDRRPKPAPDLYLLAASQLGVAPSHCLVVEDSSVGALAGRAAGMTVALLPTGV